jgi:hypothetical protein
MTIFNSYVKLSKGKLQTDFCTCLWQVNDEGKCCPWFAFGQVPRVNFRLWNCRLGKFQCVDFRINYLDYLCGSHLGRFPWGELENDVCGFRLGMFQRVSFRMILWLAFPQFFWLRLFKFRGETSKWFLPYAIRQVPEVNFWMPQFIDIHSKVKPVARGAEAHQYKEAIL